MAALQQPLNSPTHVHAPPPSTHLPQAHAPALAAQVVLCVDALQQAFVIQELQLWSFFGLLPKHVAILPLPRHHGLTQVQLAVVRVEGLAPGATCTDELMSEGLPSWQSRGTLG